MEAKETPRCAECRRKLEQGMDILGVTHSVIGPRGTIPLEEPLLFCKEQCVAEYFESGEMAPERLP